MLCMLSMHTKNIICFVYYLCIQSTHFSYRKIQTAMKPKTFDAFTKALATPESRRSALQKVLGMLGAGSLAALLPQQVLAHGEDDDDDDDRHHTTRPPTTTTTCRPTPTTIPATTVPVTTAA
jgi:hypothetical protein